MATRTSPANRLVNSPLIHVIGQARISPIFAISKYLPDFQERVRSRGFPKFKKTMVNEIIFDQAPRVEASDRFEFLAKEDTRSIILSADSVALHTTRYTVFEEFIETLMFALESLNEVAQLGVVERFGIRYINLLRRTDEMSIDAYIEPSLRGLNLKTLQLSDLTRRYEQLGKTSVGTLAVRFYEQMGQPMPIGLGLVDLTPRCSIEPGEKIALLDFDHFTESVGEFDSESVRELAWSLHDAVDIAFSSAVTKDALKAWGAEHV